MEVYMSVFIGNVNISDELPAELKHFKQREKKWLWLFLQRSQFPLADINQTPKSQQTTLLIQAINSSVDRSASINAILSASSNSILPHTAFDWINTRDTRLIAWIFNELRIKNIPVSPSFPPPQEARDELIHTLDIWNVNTESKSHLLQELKGKWSMMRTNDEQTKWLDKNNPNQSSWAWKYLLKNMRAYTPLIPISADELHTATLVSLDNMVHTHPAEKILFIKQMKKTWSQKKYRDSDKAKKQVSIPMTSNTKAKLEAIATSQGLSIGEALKKIINETSEMYLQNH